MSAPDALAALLDELAAMPGASRRAILRALTPMERAALANVPYFSRAAADNDADPVSPFSPWLAARIATARDSRSLDPAASRMTAATRQALLQKTEAPTSQPAIKPKAPVVGKSLFDTFGGKVAARMGRP